jgi:hypothetical protein
MPILPSGLNKVRLVSHHDAALSRCQPLYGVNVPVMSFRMHEWDIHIVCRGTDDASGAGGTATAHDPPYHAGRVLAGSAIAIHGGFMR